MKACITNLLRKKPYSWEKRCTRYYFIIHPFFEALSRRIYPIVVEGLNHGIRKRHGGRRPPYEAGFRQTETVLLVDRPPNTSGIMARVSRISFWN